MSEIKVFEMTDCEWYAGESLKDCKEQIRKDHGMQADDELYELEDAREMTPEQMDEWIFNYSDENGKESQCTFKERLQQMIDDGHVFPEFFASTEY